MLDVFFREVLGELTLADYFRARSTGTGLIKTFEVPGWPVVRSFDVLISSFFGDRLGLTVILSRISRSIYWRRCLPSFRFWIGIEYTSSSGFNGALTGFSDCLFFILSFERSRLSQIKLNEVFSSSSLSLILRVTSFFSRWSSSKKSCYLGFASPTISRSRCVLSSTFCLFRLLRHGTMYSVL